MRQNPLGGPKGQVRRQGPGAVHRVLARTPSGCPAGDGPTKGAAIGVFRQDFAPATPGLSVNGACCPGNQHSAPTGRLTGD